MGHGDGKIAFNAFFNPDAGQSHAALSSLPTSDVLVMYSVSTTADDPVAMLSGKQVNYDWTRGADGALMGTVTVDASAGVALEWGKLILAKTSHSGATNGSSVDNGASSANGVAAQIQVFSVTGGTSMTALLQDSADNSSFATIITFTAVAAGANPTAERKTFTGTVRRYLRAASSGTFTTAVWAMAYRRGTAQDDSAY